jgi:hypothetical protein
MQTQFATIAEAFTLLAITARDVWALVAMTTDRPDLEPGDKVFTAAEVILRTCRNQRSPCDRGVFDVDDHISTDGRGDLTLCGLDCWRRIGFGRRSTEKPTLKARLRTVQATLNAAC